MRSTRLLWQIYPSYLLITLLSLLAVTGFVSRSFKSFYLNQTRQNLEAMGRLVEAKVPQRISVDDITTIDALCDRLGLQSGVRVTLILPSGVVVGDSHEDPRAMENHGDRPEVVSALSGMTGTSIRFSTTLQTRMMYVALTPSTTDAWAPIIRIALPVIAINEALHKLYLRIGLGGLVVGLIAAFTGWAVSRRLTRPLEELTFGAERFAAGDLTGRVHVPDLAEIGALATAMNEMASQLHQRIGAMAQQRNEQDAVLSSMIESVLAIDANERMLRINTAAASLFGIDSERVQGRRVQEVIRNSELHDLVIETLKSQALVEGEITLYEPHERSLQVHANVLRDFAGHRIGAVLVLNDITALRRLERIRRDFVANVSHELKTPITTIRGFVETLMEGRVESREDADRFLGLVAKHTNRLHRIIEDLLLLSRLEQDDENSLIKRHKTSVHNVVANAIGLCEAKAELRGVKIELSGNPSIAALINPPLFEQALVNLIDNAIKYGNENSIIRLMIQMIDHQITISIKDEGPGIGDEHISRLFERFYRPDIARSRSTGGTGLGLAIVKHIALVHGGHVSVKSQLNQGSTFTLSLPS